MQNLSRTLRAIWYAFPQELLPVGMTEPEDVRHASLITGFISVGGLFALGFAVYYLLAGHHLGALAILSASLIFMVCPMLLLRRGKTHAAAMCFILTLLLMFVVLCLIEGGVKGHAVAWLAIMPFSVQLMILHKKSAVFLGAFVVLLVAVFSSLELFHIELPFTYPIHLHAMITMLGYTGLALFMFTMGFIVEHYRRKVMRQRNRAEAELKHAVEELTRLNLEKNEFLGIAAHDLSNPLSVVCGYAEMLRDLDGVSQEQMKSISGDILENALRMKRIIQNLLDVNTIESGTYPLHHENVELVPLFQSCLVNYREAAREKKLQISSSLDGVWADTDPHALAQVLDNLVSNAVKYSKLGGKIDVRLSGSGTHIQFEVFNEGRGFSEEDKSKLFYRFAKLSTRPTGGEGSVGLGLSISHKIVQAMGGSIVCESELNQGARFRVQLPGYCPGVKAGAADAGN